MASAVPADFRFHRRSAVAGAGTWRATVASGARLLAWPLLLLLLLLLLLFCVRVL